MKIAILGAGVMGGSVASGLIKFGSARYEITVSNPSSAPLEQLAAEGVTTTHDNREACRGAEMVIVAVKPWVIEKVLNEIKDTLDYERQSVVAIVAGVKGQQLLQWLEKDGVLPQVLIAMPNTAMSVAESMTFLVPLTAGDSVMAEAKQLFDYLGKSMIIDEAHLPAATALASCGIAYALRYVRAAVEGGVELGFKAALSQDIVAQTIKGATALLEQPAAHAEQEIDKVTTPGGITIRGLNEMEHSGFTSAVIRGLKVSADMMK